jgi:hypothetical protein
LLIFSEEAHFHRRFGGRGGKFIVSATISTLPALGDEMRGMARPFDDFIAPRADHLVITQPAIAGKHMLIIGHE